MLSQKNVLVLGSKAESKLPDVGVDMIYSANGAAERALDYKKYYPNTYHTAIVAANSFMKDETVKPRVIKSKPNKLIVIEAEGSISLTGADTEGKIAKIVVNDEDEVILDDNSFKAQVFVPNDGIEVRVIGYKNNQIVKKLIFTVKVGN